MEEKREFLKPRKPRSFLQRLYDFFRKVYELPGQYSGFGEHNERMRKRRRKTKFDK